MLHKCIVLNVKFADIWKHDLKSMVGSPTDPLKMFTNESPVTVSSIISPIGLGIG